MLRDNENLVITNILFQATLSQSTTLKGTIYGKMGESLEKWFKEGRRLFKRMDRVFDEDTKDDFDILQAISIDVVKALLQVKDKKDFVDYLNRYEEKENIETNNQ